MVEMKSKEMKCEPLADTVCRCDDISLGRWTLIKISLSWVCTSRLLTIHHKGMPMSVYRVMVRTQNLE